MDRIIPEMLKEQTNEQRIHSEPLFSPKINIFRKLTSRGMSGDLKSGRL